MATKDTAASTTQWLTEDEQRAWVALAHVLVELPTTLDAQLQRDAGLNLYEYFVLSRLSMTEPEPTCRMSELAEMAGGSLSRLSNVVKRLEERGWLRREPDPTNARYTNVTLTESGMDKVVEAAPGHVTAVRDLVIDPLSAAQITALAEIGEQVRCRIQSC
ncbi:MarR family winged helix-turn-helix transcriptional regulator [Aeromicrobium terrae]|uniref:MarR family transcriptional regulator n=1 Tax=Aeromicrobium terrae TaxID=2498846 RepID=A0A5C8NLP5_9ACTN|nr:MarR family transcriptional regulator [Aeromicrobium terrae]TXL62774.1 MarR family transcriptional regulator [Aeromicrobium terrae]